MQVPDYCLYHKCSHLGRSCGDRVVIQYFWWFTFWCECGHLSAV